jgi:hypothetical protein
MRPAHLARLIVLLPLAFAIGCSSNNQGKIEGTSAIAGDRMKVSDTDGTEATFRKRK